MVCPIAYRPLLASAGSPKPRPAPRPGLPGPAPRPAPGSPGPAPPPPRHVRTVLRGRRTGPLAGGRATRALPAPRLREADSQTGGGNGFHIINGRRPCVASPGPATPPPREQSAQNKARPGRTPFLREIPSQPRTTRCPGCEG